MSGEGNPGINKLARTLTGRMKKEQDTSLVLDFGEIRSNYSLVTNTFPVPIPRSDYTVCRSAAMGNGSSIALTTSSQSQNPPESHTHTVSLNGVFGSLKPGDRVLVAWVQNEAVVIDVIMSASRL